MFVHIKSTLKEIKVYEIKVYENFVNLLAR